MGTADAQDRVQSATGSGRCFDASHQDNAAQRANGDAAQTAPDRPWEAFREGSVYVVRRVKRGDSSEWETFANQGSLSPLCLDLTDAEALVKALNAEWPAVAAPERQVTKRNPASDDAATLA